MTTSTGSLDNMSPMEVSVSSPWRAPWSRRNTRAFSRLSRLGGSIKGNLVINKITQKLIHEKKKIYETGIRQ